MANVGFGITNNGTFTNYGKFYRRLATNTGSILGTGIYLQTAGQTINNDSMMQSSFTINDGTLRGIGTITANVTIGSVLSRPEILRARSPSTARLPAVGTSYSR